MSVNLDEKVVIKNLCEWDLYFPRIETSGTVKLVKKGINRLTRAEIQAQVFSNNTMFTGTDGRGSNAKIYIDDKKTRVLVGFEDEDGKEKQRILTPERVKEILNLKTLKSFKENISKDVKTQAEKLVLIEEAKKQGLNDYKKIQFIEEYTGYKFEE
jgi:hypothetical protein